MNTYQRLGAKSNAHVGRKFEDAVQLSFKGNGLAVSRDVAIQIGINGKTKAHKFDLGDTANQILIECKSHRWTVTGNVPSAKMTTWNEAMFYFLATPNTYRKLFVVLRDYSARRDETLAQYYIRIYSHLIPSDVEIWEYDNNSKTAVQINVSEQDAAGNPLPVV